MRKTIKWSGLIVAVLVATAWIGSNWYCWMWEADAGGLVCIQAGCFAVATPIWSSATTGPGVWWFEPLDADMRWWFRWSRWNLGRDIAVPLWFPFLVVAIPAALAWRLDALATRRAREGKCPKCSYDRAGLAAAAPCPECGTTA